MESFLPSDIIVKILYYLGPKSMRKYDNAITNKELRPIYLDAIRNMQLYRINYWTFLRRIQPIKGKGICDAYNTEYAHDTCTNLTVSRPTRFTDKDLIYIENHNIKYLHVDLGRAKLCLNYVCCENLTKMNIFKDIQKKCPNLQNILLIESDLSDLHSNYQQHPNISVKILSQSTNTI